MRPPTKRAAALLMSRIVVMMLANTVLISRTSHSQALSNTPPLYVLYMTEARTACIPRNCLFAKTRSLSSRPDSTSAVDEAGNRFKCDGKYWFDLTCEGDPKIETAAPPGDTATVLIDVSGSMKNYDHASNGSCRRAEAVLRLKELKVPAKVYWHAESLMGKGELYSVEDAKLRAIACASVGDNNTTYVLKEALRKHGGSKRPLIMVTDVSEQTPHLDAFLRSYGGKEFFVRADELAARLAQLLGTPQRGLATQR